MPRRQKAADFFPPETPTDQASGTEQTVGGNDASGGKPSELRRSSRLRSSSDVEVPVPKKSTKKSVLEMGQEAKKIDPHVAVEIPITSNSRTRKLSNESQSPNEAFEDADSQIATPVTSPRVEITTIKSSLTDDLYVSALEEVEVATVEGRDLSLLQETPSNNVQSTPRTTQNTLENIPSSQPRPRSERSPIPLQPGPSSTPPASFPTSTSFSELKSTTSEIHAPESDPGEEESSDDEAPEPISLSQSRSQALESQSKIIEQTKAQAEKVRGKRRHRDQLLATQKRQKTQIEEIPNSQQSIVTTELNSGNTTDAPAPNQDHQAARIASRNALPAEILQAVSSTWLQPEIPRQTQVSRPKKRKQRDIDDGGVRVLEDMNHHLAPKAGKIGISKDKMIMRMGRGERRMFIGRFAK